MENESYDIIIIGSGAGGGTMAQALAGSSARILIVERGTFVPQEEENWSPVAVWKDLRYRTTEQWVDERGGQFRPYTHYCVGGNTKFWGSVLYRLRREDFQALEHLDGISPAWPIDYETLEPYYGRAERLYHVHGEDGLDPTEPVHHAPYPYEPIRHARAMEGIVTQLRAQGLHPSPLPLGLIKPGEAGGCVLCNTCNSFPCRVQAKSDADVLCVRAVMGKPTVKLWTGAFARRLLTDASGKQVEAVEIERAGQVVRVRAAIVVVSCGAVNSAALLLRSANAAHPNGLANSSGLVGKRYMAHLATMIEAVDLGRRNDTTFSKTLAINDYYLNGPNGGYPLGQIQAQGRTHGLMAKLHAPWWGRWIPLPIYNWWVDRGYDWLAMSEDLPCEDNCVTLDGAGRIVLRYRQNNVTAHRELVAEMKRILARLGLRFPVTHSLGTTNTTHQCGTLCFGTDPHTSVLDPFCRAHELLNLFVVDASFFPSSAAVNPGLTIAAQALRVADHIMAMNPEPGLRGEAQSREPNAESLGLRAQSQKPRAQSQV
jgi:choline dehydrogenase-like flavoprotein